MKPTSAEFLENTKVIFGAQPKQELILVESSPIGEMKSCLNRQDEEFIEFRKYFKSGVTVFLKII